VRGDGRYHPNDFLCVCVAGRCPSFTASWTYGRGFPTSQALRLFAGPRRGNRASRVSAPDPPPTPSQCQGGPRAHGAPVRGVYAAPRHPYGRGNHGGPAASRSLPCGHCTAAWARCPCPSPPPPRTRRCYRVSVASLMGPFDSSSAAPHPSPPLSSYSTRATAATYRATSSPSASSVRQFCGACCAGHLLLQRPLNACPPGVFVCLFAVLDPEDARALCSLNVFRKPVVVSAECSLLVRGALYLMFSHSRQCTSLCRAAAAAGTCLAMVLPTEDSTCSGSSFRCVTT
jgi:hypothetical protein